MRTKKQKRATNRNWNKRMLLGAKSHFHNMNKVDSGLSIDEKEKVSKIQTLIAELLSEW